MTQAAFSESQFPFEVVSKLITWIPNFVDCKTSDRGWNMDHYLLYEAFINAILVFCGARPAACMTIDTIDLCKRFIRRLNRILENVQDGQCHKIEIVRRLGSSYFIT